MAENEELQLKQPKGKPHKAEDVKFVFTNIFTAIKAELLAGNELIERLRYGNSLLLQNIFAVDENITTAEQWSKVRRAINRGDRFATSHKIVVVRVVIQ